MTNKTTKTTKTPETVMDRYVALVDRAVHEPEALEELRTIFAPDATVHFVGFMDPVTGLSALMDFYRGFVAQTAEGKHFWNVRVLADGRLECEWVQAQKGVDGELSTFRGIEHATLNADGLIVHLENNSPSPAEPGA